MKRLDWSDEEIIALRRYVERSLFQPQILDQLINGKAMLLAKAKNDMNIVQPGVLIRLEREQAQLQLVVLGENGPVEAAAPPVQVISLTGPGVEKAVRHASRAFTCLDAWGAVLPIRIANEDLADFMEAIAERIARGQVCQVYLHTASAMFWTGVNAVGHFLRNVIGLKKA
jgi:hypothetical protein